MPAQTVDVGLPTAICVSEAGISTAVAKIQGKGITVVREVEITTVISKYQSIRITLGAYFLF